MFDTIGGLPVHALVVHAVVVLGPLAALLLVAYAARPGWRAGLRWPTLGLAAVAAVSAVVATSSGESLENRVGDPAYDHAEKGDLAAVSIYVLLGAAVLIAFFLARPGMATRFGAASLVLALAVTAFSWFAVFNAGHSGASSVWKGELAGSSPGTGGDAD